MMRVFAGGKFWTPEMLAEYKREYEKEQNPESTFEFGGHTWLRAYAKYLIEYVSGRFNHGNGGAQ